MANKNFFFLSVNTRIIDAHLTGVQRYLLEISKYLSSECLRIHPSRSLHGFSGHLWEQFVLPLLVGKRLLWSPSNTGPLLLRRQVVTIHDVVPLDHPEWLNRKFALFYRFLLPRLVLRVAKIITDSEFSKSRLLATTKVSADKIVVIPLGVSPRFQPRPAAAIADAMAKLALPTPRYLLTVGSIEPRKNLRTLIAAWSLVVADLPEDIWLVVAGGKGSALVFADTAGLDALPPRVHLTGHVADELLPALYAGAAAFAYMSLYEGFGLPPLEAMASGVPVLVSNGTAFPEVVADCGLYADPTNPADIAQQLLRLLTDRELAADLAARGLQRAAAFTWERCVAQTLSVFERAQG